VQGRSSFTASLKLRTAEELLTKCAAHVDDGGVLNVPVSVAVPDQVLPVSFVLRAQLTTPALSLERGGEAIQELELSRKKAYVLGRNKQQCDVAVPHDSVSRQHAAVIHGAQGADGGPSLHVIDFKSTKGTFVDQGAGWKRLPPNVPTLLPPGGRVRFGECSALLVHVVDAPAAAPAADAPAEEESAPRFGALLQSTVVTSGGVGSCVEAAAASSAQPAPAIYGNVIDGPAAAEEAGAAGEAAEEEEEEADDDEAGGFSNSDFRNALAPFMQRRAEPSADGDGKKKKKKKKKRGRADDSEDDSDAEPAAPLVLEKDAGGGGAGLMLRKQKTAAPKKSKSNSGPKIKF